MLNPLKRNYTNHLKKFVAKSNILDSLIRRRPKKKLVPDLSWVVNSSFASMGVSNQLKQVFKFIDTNGDGKLSALELKDVVLSLGMVQENDVAMKEAEGMVREMDVNGDGFVDLDEFMRVVMNDHVIEGNGYKLHDNDDDDLIEAFRVFDADNDGLISAKELQRVLARLGCRKCGIKECNLMIKGVDQDGDGFVNFDEFKSMMT